MEDKIKKIYQTSGNDFHFQVVKFLRENDWNVSISSYYTDGITDKPREVDIVAEYLDERDSSRTMGYKGIGVRLFIECKYINNDNMFWFDGISKEKAMKYANRSVYFSEGNQNIENFHYSKIDSVAKLAESNGRNKDSFYASSIQAIHPMIYMDNKHIDGANKILEYSLILCNNFDKLHRRDMDNVDGYEKIEDNFTLELNYSYLDKEKKSKNDYFLIDVVNFEKFKQFLDNEVFGKDVQNAYVSYSPSAGDVMDF